MNNMTLGAGTLYVVLPDGGQPTEIGKVTNTTMNWAPNPANATIVPAPREVKVYRSEQPIKTGRHPVCGHRFGIGSHPRKNCETCWTNYFLVNHDVSRANLMALAEGEGAAIVQEHGKDYLKRLKRFAGYVADLYQKASAGESHGSAEPL